MSTFTLAIVRGVAPDADGVELGLSVLADVDLPPDVWTWIAEHSLDLDQGHDDVSWVLVTPEPEFRAGDIPGLVAWRDVEVAVEALLTGTTPTRAGRVAATASPPTNTTTD